MNNLTVTVTSPDGRHRSNFTVSANQTIKQVIRVACAKYEIPGDKVDLYSLKHGRTILDSSSSVRLSGLLPGAKLELAISAESLLVDGSVSVALQYVGNVCKNVPRLSASVPTTLSLWNILRHFENSSQGALNILVKRGDMCMIPHLVILGQEYFGLETLDSLTLSSIGIIKGSCLVRMSHKQTELLFKDVAQKMASENPIQISCPEKQKVIAQTSRKPDSPAAPQKTTQNVPIVATRQKERNVLLFRPPNEIPSEAPDLSDDQYELRDSEARRYFANLQARSKALENAPLVSHIKVLEKQRAEMLARHPTTRIKFRLPDQYIIQASFDSEESGSSLHTFIQSCIIDGEIEFDLMIGTPAKALMKKEQRDLIGLDLVPAGTVYVNWSNVDHTKHRSMDILADTLKDSLGAQSNNRREQYQLQHSDSSLTLADGTADSPKPSASTSFNSSSSKFFKKPSWLRL